MDWPTALARSSLPITGQYRLVYSLPRFGGYFVHVLYTAAACSGEGVELAFAERGMTWTVPPAEWGGLFRIQDLRHEWRDPASRPDSPQTELLADAFRRGIAERVEWWAEMEIQLDGVRLSLDVVRVHPTDTSPGICEQAGREIIGEVANQLCQG